MAVHPHFAFYKASGAQWPSAVVIWCSSGREGQLLRLDTGHQLQPGWTMTTRSLTALNSPRLLDGHCALIAASMGEPWCSKHDLTAT